MIFLAAFTVLVMVAAGLVLFRRLACILAAGDASMPSEPDLLLLGVLPGLALVGVLATCLSLVHLLRLWAVIVLVAAIFWFLRRDVRALYAGVAQSVSHIVEATKRGNFFPALAVLAGCAILALSAALSTLPSDDVDVWVFHIPLAQSFVAHAGFFYPQMPNLFYGNQPILLELLAGTAMLAAPNFLAFDAVNIAMFIGFLLLLLSFAQREKGLQFLAIFYIFCWGQPFIWSAAEPMIDLPRSCFSVAAFLFAYRYALNFRRFDLTMSALLAGAAVAGKYSELFTPMIICLTLAPLMLRRRETWIHLFPAALAFLAVASVWYLKNWILYGNPVYPFLFGHPGLSDPWMHGYMLDIGRSFDPADRIYSTNLLSLRGWSDFATVLISKFDFLMWPVIVGLAGLLQPRPRRWMLPFWSVLLFVIWYALFFNGERWSLSAVMTTCCASFVAWAWAVDRLAEREHPLGSTLLQRIVPVSGRLAKPWSFIGSVAVLGMLFVIGVLFASGHGNSFLPKWADRNLMTSLPTSSGRERYLAQTRPGYAIYRYIGQHNLAHVLQPFDNGASFAASIYNDGHKNDWIVDWYILPEDAALTGPFLRQYDIHYFIQPIRIDPVELERWGPRHVALANAVIASLKPHSRLVFRDKFGVSLYQIQ